MKPKIGYLVDESYGWDDEQNWVFYEENDIPDGSLNRTHKRIVYWEIEDE